MRSNFVPPFAEHARASGDRRSEIVADRIRLALVQLLVAHQGLVVIAVAASLQGVLRWSCSLRVGLLEQTLFFGGAAMVEFSGSCVACCKPGVGRSGAAYRAEPDKLESSAALKKELVARACAC